MKGSDFIETIENYSNSNVKFLRENFGLNQGQLSKALKIDQSTVAKWEANERNITLEWAFKLSAFFKVNLSDFLTCNLKLKQNEKEENEHDDIVKHLETDTGIKISYIKDGPLSAEDVLTIQKELMKTLEEEQKK